MSDYLKFTDYILEQHDSMFRVNTDTVVLGMSLDFLKGKTVLDIGTNTGALLLYAARQSAAKLIGCDIFAEALTLADKNLKRYNLNYELHHCRVQDLNIEPVDVIVCNPPFFEMNNVAKDEYFRKAMFDESLKMGELFSSFRRLLKDNGEIYLIYAADRFNELYACCLKYKLKIMKLRFLHDANAEFALRVVMKLKIGPMTKTRILSPVIVKDGEFTV